MESQTVAHVYAPPGYRPPTKRGVDSAALVKLVKETNLVERLNAAMYKEAEARWSRIGIGFEVIVQECGWMALSAWVIGPVRNRRMVFSPGRVELPSDDEWIAVAEATAAAIAVCPEIKLVKTTVWDSIAKYRCELIDPPLTDMLDGRQFELERNRFCRSKFPPGTRFVIVHEGVRYSGIVKKYSEFRIGEYVQVGCEFDSDCPKKKGGARFGLGSFFGGARKIVSLPVLQSAGI